jgi:hypothetical protein
MNKSVWLFSKKIDLIFLFLPVWTVWLWSFGGELENKILPIWAWVVFIIGIDVGHVWSTLFRTYFNKSDRLNHKKPIRYIPLILLPVLFCVAFYSLHLFWSILAYVAVFHFIKQQYGFMVLYSFKNQEKNSPVKQRFDKWVIYIGMLYPVIYWHFDVNRSFNWFAEKDFLPLFKLVNNMELFSYLNVFYFLLLFIWVTSEIVVAKKEKIAIGKILWVVSTYLNWYLGIVFFNSDYVFSITNVVAHGVPYFVLIIKYKIGEEKIEKGSELKLFDVILNIFSVLILVLFVAFFEEYFWDMLVNLEKHEIFVIFSPYWINIEDSPVLIALSVAILTLPQATHYAVDGVIWKFNSDNPKLKKIIENG